MESKDSRGNGMAKVYAVFVLWTVLIMLLSDLQQVHAAELEPGLRAQWTEQAPPMSLTDRCQSVKLDKKGRYKVEIQSPALSSGLWIENHTADARVLTRSVAIHFEVCRPGHVIVCETTPSALGQVDLSVEEEDPDPLEVLVDEDPLRIDLCGPWTPWARSTLMTALKV